jgi:hypothetical protein
MDNGTGLIAEEGTATLTGGEYPGSVGEEQKIEIKDFPETSDQ